MSKEISGFNNKVTITSEGNVAKTFEDLGLTELSARERLEREVFALTCTLLTTPSLIGVARNQVTMSFVEGEDDLDNKTVDMPEHLQHSVFYQAGIALREIHNMNGRRFPSEYHGKIVHGMETRINGLEDYLAENGIDAGQLSLYARESYFSGIVESAHYTYTHGDFWMNNLVGRIDSDEFRLSAVVDWETGGFGSPFQDFGLIELSVENAHEISKESFWKGYGAKPDADMKRYFAVRQILMWMNGENSRDFSSQFYQEKFRLIRETL